MIIWGWRRIVTKIGPRKAYHCNHCNNDGYWELVKIARWFTLFFIPIFPYQVKKVLMCPICQSYIELSNEEFQKLKNMDVKNPEDIDNYGKTETQINYLKQMKESNKEENGTKAENNNLTAALSDNNTVDKGEVSTLTRAAATLIDFIIYIAIVLSEPHFGKLKVIGGLLLLALSITQLVLLSNDGQSIGKKILKIKIVKVDTNTNGGFVKNYLIRTFLNSILYVTVIYGIVDMISIIRKDRRCIHDLMAGTKVVKA
jgi:hypothetical protein